MGLTRRLSSRLSGQRTIALRNEEKNKKKEKAEKKKAEKRKRKPIPVHVRILTGRPITISVSPDDTMDEVMAKIESKEGISPDQQILLFNGVKVEFDDTVFDCNIRENDTLFLTLRNRGG